MEETIIEQHKPIILMDDELDMKLIDDVLKYNMEMIRTSETLFKLQLTLCYPPYAKVLLRLPRDMLIVKFPIPITYIGEPFVSYVCSVLNSNSTLEVLNLSGCRLDCKNMLPLAKALQSNTSLLELHLGGNPFKDDAAEHLSAALLQNTTLRVLDLSSTRITNRGAESLARALEQNNTLEELYLRENGLNNKGVKCFISIFQANSSLSILNVNGINFHSRNTQRRLYDGLQRNRRNRKHKQCTLVSLLLEKGVF